MISQVGYKKKTVTVNQREFLVQIVPFDNGDFISITEGKEKIGTIVVSISSAGRTSTATVIPSKSDTTFLKMVSERVASTINGICVFSLNVQKELELDIMKVLMNDIMEIIRQ
ncbi:MAG TPA: hypothetical protein VEJ68_06110 [Candidatus Bathyarchaeia archaeon]|nr:hypothetical protein [Candidatus Bathyarchaeia archaeon]